MLCFFSYRHLEAKGHGDYHDQPRREGPAGSYHSYSASHGPPILRQRIDLNAPLCQEPAERPNRRYDKLRKQGAEEFVGTTDPLVAETWFKRTERILNQMYCTPEERYDYATSLLQGAAWSWWETVPNSQVYPPVLTYGDFVREFKNNYAPDIFKDEKRKEFLNLKQGNMSVAEYEIKFNQLSAYALNLIATEKDKCRQFEEGLKYGIRCKLTTTDLESYARLRAAATRAERLEKERQEFLPRVKRGRGNNIGESSRLSGDRRNIPTSSFRGGRSGSFISGGRGRGAVTSSQPLCSYCGRRHPGECRMKTGACYLCGSFDHFYRDCPQNKGVGRATSEPTVERPTMSGASNLTSKGRGRGRPMSMGRGVGTSEAQSSKPQGQARVFAMTRQEAIEAPEVVTGKVLIHDLEAYALVDPGSTHSFISSAFALHLHDNHTLLGYNLNVSTPLGDLVIVDRVYRDCNIRIGEIDLPADLIVLTLREFDVILGMDWLSHHHAVVNCYTKEVMFEPPDRPRVAFHGERQMVPSCLISAVNAFKLIQKGCTAYLAHVVDTTIIQNQLETIPVVREFSDIFPDDLPGLPPDRETEFTIELVPGTAPISIPPYRMAPMELQELKKQLQELLDKGYIRPSVSPWGAPVLFVKKKDGTLRLSIDY